MVDCVIESYKKSTKSILYPDIGRCRHLNCNKCKQYLTLRRYAIGATSAICVILPTPSTYRLPTRLLFLFSANDIHNTAAIVLCSPPSCRESERGLSDERLGPTRCCHRSIVAPGLVFLCLSLPPSLRSSLLLANNFCAGSIST